MEAAFLGKLLADRKNERPLSDEELMAGLAAGDMSSLGTLYVRYSNWVRRVLVRIVPGLNRFEVDDLCQEVFLSVYSQSGRYVESGKFRSWLYTIAARAATGHRRKRLLRMKILDNHMKSFGAEDRMAAPPGVRPEVAEAIVRLPRAQREAILLHTVDGFSCKEIAEALGIDQNAVWTRLHRARKSLHDALAERK